MGNKNMKLKRFSEEEKVVLREFVKSHEAEGKLVAYSEMAELSSLLDKVNGSLGRVPTRIWDGLKRFGGMTVAPNGEPKPAAPKGMAKKIAGSEAAAKKILDELTPIIKFMGKLPEYLKPLELLLAEHQALAGRLLVAEGKIAATKEGKKTAKASVAVAKATAKKIKEMGKELKTLRNFLTPAKILLRETCDLRMQAAALTKHVEEMKKRNGTNLFEFLKELEDCKSLQE